MATLTDSDSDSIVHTTPTRPHRDLSIPTTNGLNSSVIVAAAAPNTLGTRSAIPATTTSGIDSVGTSVSQATPASLKRECEELGDALDLDKAEVDEMKEVLKYDLKTLLAHNMVMIKKRKGHPILATINSRDGQKLVNQAFLSGNVPNLSAEILKPDDITACKFHIGLLISNDLQMSMKTSLPKELKPDFIKSIGPKAGTTRHFVKKQLNNLVRDVQEPTKEVLFENFIKSVLGDSEVNRLQLMWLAALVTYWFAYSENPDEEQRKKFRKEEFKLVSIGIIWFRSYAWDDQWRRLNQTFSRFADGEKYKAKVNDGSNAPLANCTTPMLKPFIL